MAGLLAATATLAEPLADPLLEATDDPLTAAAPAAAPASAETEDPSTLDLPAAEDPVAADPDVTTSPLVDQAVDQAAAPAVDLAATLTALTDRSFAVKEQAVADLIASGDPRALALLKALLDGQLQTRADDDRVVLTRRHGDGFALTDPLTGTDLGQVDRRGVRRIVVNNRMRIAMRAGIARLTLASPDPAQRLQAAQAMLSAPDADDVAVLRERLAIEDDARVQSLLRLGIGVATLDDPDPAVRIDGVAALAGSLQRPARNALRTLLATETDAKVRAAAESALADIERLVAWNRHAQTLFFGLSLGSVLVLAAIGLAISFGVMGVINMAHGELIMLGAYTTYMVQGLMPNAVDWSLLVALPAAFIVAGLAGIAIEQTVIRFLYGRPLETLLATFGISLILQQAVRTLISAQNVAVASPSWMSGSLQINPVLSLTYNRIYILLFTFVVFAALLLILRRTALGLQVRAVAQNRSMARAMGVRSARVDALTFGLGAGVAGVAGVALSQLTNVGPNMGQNYIIDSFMVVVFGGVGNLWGTMIGGMTLGVVNKLMEPWTGAVLAKILVLVLIILFIQKRPRGLFPQRGRAAET